jgi:hypothetical protein
MLLQHSFTPFQWCYQSWGFQTSQMRGLTGQKGAWLGGLLQMEFCRPMEPHICSSSSSSGNSSSSRSGSSSRCTLV